jgi:hypothetical protein
MIDTKLKTYRVRVRVDYDYEVEALDDSEAEQEGWSYEDYSHFGTVYSIDVEEIEADE